MKKRLPDWFRQEIPDMAKIRELKRIFNGSQIHTVCQEAKCPNMGQCWQNQVATFMILGRVCTRNCRFCAVAHGKPSAINPHEPRKVAEAVSQLKLKYVVITSVTRDDLEDEGAGQFVETVKAIREISPFTKIELLIPDLSWEKGYLAKVIEAKPDVIGHNMETVKRVFAAVRQQADYEKSLNILARIKEMDPSMIVKSGFMVGLGESYGEIIGLMRDLFGAKCDILSIGQYLAPSVNAHVKESRFIPLEEFDAYKEAGIQMGFAYIMSGPTVRSSFLAEEGYSRVAHLKRMESKKQADEFFPFYI